MMIAPIERSNYPTMYRSRAAEKYIKAAQREALRSKSLSYLSRIKTIEAQVGRTRSRSDNPMVLNAMGSSVPAFVRNRTSRSLDSAPQLPPVKEEKEKEAKSAANPGSPRPSPKLPTPPVRHIGMRHRGTSECNELRRYIATRKLQALQAEAAKDGIKINIKYPGVYMSRSLSEGSMPLAVIAEEPEDEANEQKRQTFIKKWWKKLKPKPKQSTATDAQ